MNSQLIHAALTFSDSSMKSSEISETLNLRPDEAHDAGDVFTVNGILRSRNSTYWCFSTSGKVESKILEDHLKFIVKSIPKISVLNEVSSTCNRAWIDVFIFSECGFSCELSTEILQNLSETGILLQISYYS